ncbi:MAG: hypothetical protein HOW73_04650 [Polyangiaceae bacterium]|nr:hypothetical protein [Polyangiaceae bacterium]
MKVGIQWLTTAFEGLLRYLPNLIGGLLILLIGYIIARILARVTRTVSVRLGLNRLLWKIGVLKHETTQGSEWAGKLVFGVVMLATIMQAARAFELRLIADGIAEFLAYLPHVFAAALIFGAALFIGNWVRDRLLASRMFASEVPGSREQRFVPAGVRAIIIAVGVFMALRELQVASEIVNAAFILTLGAVALAVALAFGLGSRDVAARMSQSWYERRPT